MCLFHELEGCVSVSGAWWIMCLFQEREGLCVSGAWWIMCLFQELKGLCLFQEQCGSSVHFRSLKGCASVSRALWVMCLFQELEGLCVCFRSMKKKDDEDQASPAKRTRRALAEQRYTYI